MPRYIGRISIGRSPDGETGLMRDSGGKYCADEGWRIWEAVRAATPHDLISKIRVFDPSGFNVSWLTPCSQEVTSLDEIGKFDGHNTISLQNFLIRSADVIGCDLDMEGKFDRYYDTLIQPYTYPGVKAGKFVRKSRYKAHIAMENAPYKACILANENNEPYLALLPKHGKGGGKYVGDVELYLDKNRNEVTLRSTYKEHVSRNDKGELYVVSQRNSEHCYNNDNIEKTWQRMQALAELHYFNMDVKYIHNAPPTSPNGESPSELERWGNEMAKLRYQLPMILRSSRGAPYMVLIDKYHEPKLG